MVASDFNVCGTRVVVKYAFHINYQWCQKWRIFTKMWGVLKYLLQSFQIDAKNLNSRTSLKVYTIYVYIYLHHRVSRLYHLTFYKDKCTLFRLPLSHSLSCPLPLSSFSVTSS